MGKNYKTAKVSAVEFNTVQAYIREGWEIFDYIAHIDDTAYEQLEQEWINGETSDDSDEVREELHKGLITYHFRKYLK